MRRAEHVAIKHSDLLSKIDTGETTIYGAYREAAGMEAENSQALDNSATSKGSSDQIARAEVIWLLKNSHFLELREELANMRAQATAAKNTLKRATEGYVNKVKHFENNIGFLSRRVKELKDENDVLRASGNGGKGC